MTGLIVAKKTGFKNNTPGDAIVIRDFRGKIFYSSEGLRCVKRFNLPEGNYFVESGDFTVLNDPVFYEPIAVPYPERNFEKPFNYTLIFAPNINKCTINWDRKTITFDPSLLEMDLPALYFVLYHEYGHHLYNTEKYADSYACNMMLKKGYNPSQIGKGQINTLSSRQDYRKDYIVNNLIR